MSLRNLTFALTFTLCALSAAFGQEPQSQVVLKRGDVGVAALTLSEEGTVLVGYVASGRGVEKANEINWSEVRLMDVASGKHRLLSRYVTAANVPGTGANHALLGFSPDGKTLAVRTIGLGGNRIDFTLDVATGNKLTETEK